MANSYTGQISKLRLGDTDYALHDTKIHSEISYSIQSISDFADHVANSLNGFSSFVTNTSKFMSNSYISADNISYNEYFINIFIDK